MKSEVLHTVWCNISGEAAGGKFEIYHSWEWKAWRTCKHSYAGGMLHRESLGIWLGRKCIRRLLPTSYFCGCLVVLNGSVCKENQRSSGKNTVWTELPKRERAKAPQPLPLCGLRLYRDHAPRRQAQHFNRHVHIDLGRTTRICYCISFGKNSSRKPD